METTITQTLAQEFPSLAEIPAEIRLTAPLHQQHILINGELIKWNGPTHEVYSPIYISDAVGEKKQLLIGSYPLGTMTEAEAALLAATAAYNAGNGEWPAMSVNNRIKALQDFTRRMLCRREEIVKLIVWEIAKSIPDAEKEFDRTIEYIHETIREVKELSNKTAQFTVYQGFIGQTKKVPHGVVLCMGPFNYPLNETFTTLIPALIMGNTILFKPPKHGTLLFEPLLEAFAEVFPKGVVNTVYGRGRDIVPVLMHSGKVDVLALIGSSRVADSLKKMHPKSNRLKSILGLDAKNAAIILEEADVELALKEVVAGTLSFNGQRCTALKILFVHDSLTEHFNSRLAEEVDKLIVGMPWKKGVSITPLAEPGKPQYLSDVIEDAIAHGAKIINEENGGGLMSHSLVKPVILYPVNKNMRVYKEEQFGPLIPIVPFSDLQVPIDYVIDSPYGQQVSLFGNDSAKLSYLIDMLASQVGRININAQCQRSPDTFPFNGRKDSAEGTLSVEEALHAFSVDSVVVTKQTAENEEILETILASGNSKRLNNKVLF